MKELQETIMERGRILYERITRCFRGNHRDFQMSVLPRVDKTCSCECDIQRLKLKISIQTLLVQKDIHQNPD